MDTRKRPRKCDHDSDSDSGYHTPTTPRRSRDDGIDNEIEILVHGGPTSEVFVNDTDDVPFGVTHNLSRDVDWGIEEDAGNDDDGELSMLDPQPSFESDSDGEQFQNLSCIEEENTPGNTNTMDSPFSNGSGSKHRREISTELVAHYVSGTKGTRDPDILEGTLYETGVPKLMSEIRKKSILRSQATGDGSDRSESPTPKKTVRFSIPQKFQAGQRIEVTEAFVIDDKSAMKLAVGTHGTILTVDDDGDAAVRFDGDSGGHWVFKKNFDRMRVVGQAAKILSHASSGHAFGVTPRRAQGRRHRGCLPPPALNPRWISYGISYAVYQLQKTPCR